MFSCHLIRLPCLSSENISVLSTEGRKEGPTERSEDQVPDVETYHRQTNFIRRALHPRGPILAVNDVYLR